MHPRVAPRSRLMVPLLMGALLMVPARAAANGRFPSASQLVVDPEDPQHVAVRTTFGLLQTTDGGSSWRWVCEKALGYTGVFDPAIAITGGSIVVGLPDGMSRSSDRGCQWTRLGALAGEWVIDNSVDPTSPRRIVAVTELAAGSAPGSQAIFAESLDAGQTWTNSRLPEDFRPISVDIAPSNPKRIYASGHAPFPRFASLIRSENNFVTWTESTFDMGTATDAYLSGVDPTNADRVYLRLDGDTEDELLFSSDGGATINKIFAGKQLLGFAISPDGKHVAVGGPGVGLHVSGPEHAFVKVSELGVRCLTWTASGLYVCGSDPLDPFAIGRTSAIDAPLTPLLRFVDLEPLVCAAGTTTQDTCPAFWGEVVAVIKPKPAVDAGTDGATDTGTPGGDAGPIGAEPTDAGAAPGPVSPGDGGCDCRFGHGSAGASALALFALALAARRALRLRSAP